MRARSASAAWIAIAASLAWAGCGIREDELRCEQAAAHLADCCPGFAPSLLDCGDGDGHTPDLPLAASLCIEGSDCGTLVGTMLCDRVQQAVQNRAAGQPMPVTCP